MVFLQFWFNVHLSSTNNAFTHLTSSWINLIMIWLPICPWLVVLFLNVTHGSLLSIMSTSLFSFVNLLGSKMITLLLIFFLLLFVAKQEIGIGLYHLIIIWWERRFLESSLFTFLLHLFNNTLNFFLRFFLPLLNVIFAVALMRN